MAIRNDHEMMYGDLAGFSLKKLGKFLSKPIKNNPIGKFLGKVAQVSLLPFAAAVKPITWVGAKAGIKPLVKANKAVNQLYRYAGTHPLQILGAEALVAGAAFAAPAGAAAAPATAPAAPAAAVAAPAAAGVGGTTLASGGGLLATAATAAEQAAKKFAADQAKKALAVIQGGGAKPAVAPQVSQPGAPGAGAPIVPLAAAGAGFVAGGPVGAIIGGVVGYLITKK